MSPGDVVEVVTLPGYDDLPDMRGYLGEVVGVAIYSSGSVVSVEFGPHSPADLNNSRHYDEHRWSGCPALGGTDDEDRLAERTGR